jgi:hypothetical protein
LAELEAKLKAAEAEAAKTPEQKAEEARVAAEAKAYAEAKVAAEMKAAAEEKALAEARAAAEAKAAAEARAAEEARAAAEAKAAAEARAAADAKILAQRRAAEAERNKPLQKAKLRQGTTYKWYRDGSCRSSEKEQCLNLSQYKQMCRWAQGFTVNVRSMAAVMFRYPYSDFLRNGGEFTNGRYSWNEQLGQCRASWSIVGLFKGTSVRENFSGYASNFIVNSSNRVLIHYVAER